MAEKKPLGYGSYVIAHCPVCAEPAAFVCITCKKARCKEHSTEFGEHPCVHNRKHHDGLRKLSEGGMVVADDITFIS